MEQVQQAQQQQAPPDSDTPPPQADNHSPQSNVSPQQPPALPVNRKESPLCRLTAKEAEEYEQADIYDISRRTDIECAEAIVTSILTYKEGENHYDLITPAEVLLEEYGAERMKWVLSCHINASQSGFAAENITWAQNFLAGDGNETPILISTHNAVINAFVAQLRTILEKQPDTFIERMKYAKRKSDEYNKQNGGA